MGKAKRGVLKDEKKIAKKAAQEAEVARQAAIRNAYALGDPFEALKPFLHYNRNGLDVTLKHVTAGELSKDDKDWIMKTLSRNMKPFYEDEWPKAEAEKRKDMMDDDSRYVLVHLREASGTDEQESTEVTNDTFPTCSPAVVPIAFVQYRFVIEDDQEVLYVYELQLTEAARRKGLGKFLMQFIELVARKSGMKGVMLTVQRLNKGALNFYESMRYQIDQMSPSQCDDSLSPPVDHTYEILSKMWS